MQSRETHFGDISSAIARSVGVAVFSAAYANMVLFSISDPSEILVSMLASAFSLFSLAPFDSKKKLAASTLFSAVLFFIPDGYWRAGIAGAVSGYTNSVVEIYAARLSLVSLRTEAMCFAAFTTALQHCAVFFSFTFLPLPDFLRMPAFVFPLLGFEVFLVLRHACVPPAELMEKKGKDSGFVYGEVYTALLDIFRGTPFLFFHREYSELVDVSAGEGTRARNRLYSVVQRLNFSFLATAARAYLLVAPRSTFYLVVLTLLSVFNWVYANQEPERYFEMYMLSVSLCASAMILLGHASPFTIILIACSIYIIPGKSCFPYVDSSVIVCTNVLRQVLASALFFLSQYPNLTR